MIKCFEYDYNNNNNNNKWDRIVARRREARNNFL